MSTLKIALLSVALTALVAASPTWSKSKPSLVSNMQAYLIKKNAEGVEYRQPAKQTEPGSILEYNLTYTNQTDKPLNGLIVSGPIPPNTLYVGNSAKTDVKSELLVSIDGGASYEKEPVKRQKRMADGTMKMVTVSPEKYTNLRWKAKEPMLRLGGQLYTYRVKVK